MCLNIIMSASQLVTVTQYLYLLHVLLRNMQLCVYGYYRFDVVRKQAEEMSIQRCGIHHYNVLQSWYLNLVSNGYIVANKHFQVGKPIQLFRTKFSPKRFLTYSLLELSHLRHFLVKLAFIQ